MILRGLLLNDPYERPRPGWLRIESERLAELGDGQPPEQADRVTGDGTTLIVPGFIDAHLHLSQFDSIGYDGMELMEWLERVIFPAEMRWSDARFAAEQIERAYRQMLRAGTLGYAGFLTSHFHDYIEVVRMGQQWPLRALVGQSLMDRNAPVELLGHTMARIACSARSRVQASISPRFAVACSDALLARAGAMAVGGAFIQTHLAESKQECEMVRQSFPKDEHYTAVYDRHGLLTERTLLAHCVHLSSDEWRLIAKRRAVVVHCPTANTFLQSGTFDLDAAREHQVRLALGSDIAAGPDIAMPRVARAMIETAKVRRMTINPTAYVPSPAEAWRLITTGNAEALGWTDAGRISVGGMADLLLLRLPFEIDDHLIGRLIHTWRDDYVVERIVAGKRLNVETSKSRQLDRSVLSRDC
jgi:guanine deaminase